ncbi:MAG: iron-containing alcohol dehydrogenase, partial [Deltaproteobacteria bacterium]|nr:iron-containing alcohol dehydrogenase [Deltaproteobacteria bacterium]
MEKRRKEPRVAIPVYGRGLLSGIPDEFFKRPAIFTQPEPWEIVRESFAGDAKPVFVTTMDHGVVGELAAAATGASAVLGIGGGSAMDMAKYAAWKNALPLALLPTILSVDAAFTKAIAVRKGSRVRYFGEVFPDYLLIDFGILRQSPAILNKSGVGDILSIFSALWDWKEAHQRLGEFYDPEIAAGARDLLDRLFAGADEIRDVTDEGLRLISELYAGEVRLCELVGNSRPEEGSE